MVALRAYRLARVQAQLRRQDYAGAVLFDPLNIRYATGARQFSLWSARSLARYAFVPAEGKVVLFEYPKPGAMAIARGLESCGEVRPAKTWYFFGAGAQATVRAREWAREVAELVHGCIGGNKRVAIDRLDAPSMHALETQDLEVYDAQEVLERARLIKSKEELACMSISLSVCEAGMARMREALRPGITENRLWSLLHQTNIELGGEWIETRLLASGGRTNPWYQECSDRTIRAGDLVTFDTDLIGPFGYCADVSRSFFCGPGKPSAEQKALYQRAVEQIAHNMALLKPGLTFREFCERSWPIPERYQANRVSALHGIGVADEYPSLPNLQDVATLAEPDAVFEVDMTVCVESYIGAEGGAEGVKLEQQVVITPQGAELLSTFPFEDELLD
jgi:Xaa-Pro aminopeptidase